MMRYLLNLFMISSLFLGINCRQKTVEQMGYDCEGKPTATITDALARIPDKTVIALPHIMLKEEAIVGNKYTKDFMVCNSMLKGLAGSEDYEYLVSGHVRPFSMKTSLPAYWRLEITSIRKR